MHRRQFLQNTFAGALGLAAVSRVRSLPSQFPAAAAPIAAAPITAAPTGAIVPALQLRGVNLGSWLLVEKWMTPRVFRDTNAPDEYELCRVLGPRAAQRLNEHRETFITAEDFRWIKAHGLNAVRLPVGYWALEAPAPYVQATRFVDFAFEQAQKNGLKVVLDLHGALGSQNAWDHSGRGGTLGWHTDPKNIQQTLRVLESFAQRYGKHPALYGIELLNEPRWDVPMETLKTFYQDAYARIRRHTGERVAIVFHDAFRPLEWKNFMVEPQYLNVLLDMHLYQAYTDEDRKRTISQHVAAALDRKNQIEAMGRPLSTMVGEWSIALPGEVWRNQSPFQTFLGKRTYGDAQLLSYETTRGWFYWSYKLEHDSDWSFRHCVEQGTLPNNFAA